MTQAAPIRCYIIAGETSGEQLGAGLMEALKEQTGGNIRFHGIGGKAMQQAGLESLFPMQELSVMGFAEIVPHILRLKRRIRETVADIRAKEPDVVVSIDSPGFVFRVVRQLREQGYAASRFVHYVAPTVWAYKPERAAKTAKLFDALLTLFSFEPPYFTREGLPTYWCGHPAAWKPLPARQASTVPTLCLFPGSRRGELKHMLPLYRQILETLRQDFPALALLMPLPAHLHASTQQAVANWPYPVEIVDSSTRDAALARADAALCKSGTISLEVALAGVPGIITYKANPISIWLAKRMVKIPYAGLPNILLRRPVMPEFLQPTAADISRMASALSALLKKSDEATQQTEAFTELRQLLLPETGRSPSAIAAQHVLDYAARREAVSSS